MIDKFSIFDTRALDQKIDTRITFAVGFFWISVMLTTRAMIWEKSRPLIRLGITFNRPIFHIPVFQFSMLVWYWL